MLLIRTKTKTGDSNPSVFVCLSFGRISRPSITDSSFRLTSRVLKTTVNVLTMVKHGPVPVLYVDGVVVQCIVQCILLQTLEFVAKQL